MDETVPLLLAGGRPPHPTQPGGAPDLEPILRLAVAMFGAKGAFVETLHDDGDTSLRAHWGLPIDAAYLASARAEHARCPETTLVLGNDRDELQIKHAVAVPPLRFYLGQPLRGPAGRIEGVLGIVDDDPHGPLSLRDRANLADLTRMLEARLAAANRMRADQEWMERSRLRERLVGVAAEAPDSGTALRVTAALLMETSDALYCHVFRRAPVGDGVQFVDGVGQGVFGSEAYFARLRALSLNMTNSFAGRAMASGQQVIRRNFQLEHIVGLPAANLAASHNLSAQITTPFSLHNRHHVMSIGFDRLMPDFENLAERLADCTAALRPMLRRFEDEEKVRLFRRVLDASPEPVVITEIECETQKENRIIYVNPAQARETGYSLDEMIGNNPRMFNGPDDGDAGRENIRNALLARRPIRQEILNYRKDGSSFWVEVNIAPVADALGWFTHCVSVNRNITERREAEQARAMAVRELGTLMSAMPGVLMRLRQQESGEWVSSFVARSIEHLTGHSVAEALEAGWCLGNIELADQPKWLSHLSGALSDNQLMTEFRFRRKDQRWIRVRVVTRLHLNAQGTPEVIAIWTDVTKEFEMAAQLAQSTKLAQLGEVATGMAHELNQPLTAMSLAAENALRALTRLPETRMRVEEKLNVIVAMAARASSLVSHMQVFGRVGTEEREAVRWSSVVSAVVPLVSHRMLQSDVRLRIEPMEGLPPVLARAVPLEQVLMNLISNCCDAYDEAGGDLTPDQRVIRLRAGQEGDSIFLTAQDHAGGIPEEALPSIFLPFFTTKPVNKGTGLGLSISYGIVTDLGGTITVSNGEGGALFTIILPMVPPHCSAEAS